MSSKILITRIKGGLGNQLFCYASARRLALVNDAELVIDDISGFAYDKKYQRSYALGNFNISARKARPSERFVPFERIRRALNRRLSRNLPLNKRRYIYQNGVKFDAELLDLQLQTGITYFDGFGQSEKYFADMDKVIRSDLVIRPPTDTINQQISAMITSTNSVALHVRWFESQHVQAASNISSSYYHEAIEKILSVTNQPHFFIFSDNADATKLKLDGMLSGINKTYVTHNKSESMAYADMWLMSLCKNFVIANSTFGWWAAWLGEKKGISNVIAPSVAISASENITAWGFDGLLPERWILL